MSNDPSEVWRNLQRQFTKGVTETRYVRHICGLPSRHDLDHRPAPVEGSEGERRSMPVLSGDADTLDHSRYAGGGGPTPRAFGTLGLAGLAFGGYVLFNTALFNVDGGCRAVKYSRLGGVQPDIYPEGTHLRIPWVESPIIYDVRAKPRNVASLTGTKDLQMVNITCRVLSRPRVDALPQIYRTLGQDYDERVLPSIVNEVLKSVVAQFNASQLITQRENVSRLVRDQLTKRAARFNILLDDVSLTHLAFSPEFTAAVEAKQVAQQEAQRAAFVVDKARQEKQAMVVRAQGEARSAQLIGEAIKKSRSYVDLRTLENARAIAQVLERSANKVYLDTEGLGLNVAVGKGDKKE